jgi:hypothetical protein
VGIKRPGNRIGRPEWDCERHQSGYDCHHGVRKTSTICGRDCVRFSAITQSDANGFAIAFAFAKPFAVPDAGTFTESNTIAFTISRATAHRHQRVSLARPGRGE